jgi:hypothetical protein
MIFLAAALLFAVYDGGTVPAGVDQLLVLPGTEPPKAVNAIRVEPITIRQIRPTAGDLLVLAGGVWPDLKPNIAIEGAEDVGFANATEEPWVDSNGWILRYARAVEPAKSIVLIHEPEAKPRPAIIALATAEAAVFGGSFAVPSSSLADPRVAAQRKFIAEHAPWFAGTPEAPVAVLADNLEPIAEVMNLLVRRNVPFIAFRRDRWPESPPAVLVSVGQPPLPESVVRKWSAAKTQIIHRDDITDPNAFAIEIRKALGDRRPFRITNGQQVIANLVGVDDGKRVLHLLNYGIDPIQDVRVQLSRPANRATLYTPGTTSGRTIEIHLGEFSVPEMAIHAAVLLED